MRKLQLSVRSTAAEMARKGRKPGAITHGTRTGFITHKSRGEEPCGPCRRADAAYKRDVRARGKCAPGLGWPLLPAREAGYGA